MCQNTIFEQRQRRKLNQESTAYGVAKLKPNFHTLSFKNMEKNVYKNLSTDTSLVTWGTVT